MDGAVSRNNTLDERKEVVAVVGVTAGRRFLMARPPVLTGQNGEVLKIFFFINRRSSVDNVTNSSMVFSAWLAPVKMIYYSCVVYNTNRFMTN